MDPKRSLRIATIFSDSGKPISPFYPPARPSFTRYFSYVYRISRIVPRVPKRRRTYRVSINTRQHLVRVRSRMYVITATNTSVTHSYTGPPDRHANFFVNVSVDFSANRHAFACSPVSSSRRFLLSPFFLPGFRFPLFFFCRSSSSFVFLPFVAGETRIATGNRRKHLWDESRDLRVHYDASLACSVHDGNRESIRYSCGKGSKRSVGFRGITLLIDAAQRMARGLLFENCNLLITSRDRG